MTRENLDIKFGLKLWSKNTDLLDSAESLYKEGLFHYVELYVIPDTYDETIDCWKKFSGPYIIHCSHSDHGFNLAKDEKRETNCQIFNEVKQFADVLNAERIILHGGNDGSSLETIAQIQKLADERFLLENKPMIGLNNCICIGWNPMEIQEITKAANISGVTFDFAHAYYAANASGQDSEKLIDEFLSLNPVVFHLSDGDKSLTQDKHLNFGQGDFPLKEWVSKIPLGVFVTIEAPRRKGSGLDDFQKDLLYIRSLVEAEE